MGRKRKLHSTDAPPEEEAHSRADRRRQRQDDEAGLLELAGRLVALEEEDLERVALPEEVGEAVAAARACRPGKPRNRALRLVRARLRGAEDELTAGIRQQLDSAAKA